MTTWPRWRGRPDSQIRVFCVASPCHRVSYIPAKVPFASSHESLMSAMRQLLSLVVRPDLERVDSSAVYKTEGSVALGASAGWKQFTFHVTDGYFGNRQIGGADFRIHKTGGGFFYLDLAYVRDYSGGTPRIRIVPPPGRLAPRANEFDGQQFRDLFEHPNEWSRTRSLVDALGYYDHIVNRFSDAELGSWLPEIQAWGLKFFLEVGALNEWCPTGQTCFDAARPLWDRMIRLGARIDGFTMDEPFFKVRRFGLGTDAHAFHEVAQWITLVRKNCPNAEIGSIEPYPSLSRIDLEHWITGLNNRLATLGVPGIDFFSLDADWRRFPADGNWSDVKKLEDFCRARGVPFSLIYWGATANVSTLDAAWSRAVMLQGRNYAEVGGAPDEFDIQSWLFVPQSVLPETAENTFTRSVQDLVLQHAPQFRNQPFLRGDCDGDQAAQMSDAIFVLNFLFADGVRSDCPAACDANGDLWNDVSDAVYLLEFKFAGGPTPGLPFPGCGSAPETDGALECRRRACD